MCRRYAPPPSPPATIGGICILLLILGEAEVYAYAEDNYKDIEGGGGGLRQKL